MKELHVVQNGPEYCDPWEALAGAICARAAKDYRFYGEKLLSCVPEKKAYYKYQLLSIRRFFRSEWYKVLCDIDGESVLKVLDKEVFGID